MMPNTRRMNLSSVKIGCQVFRKIAFQTSECLLHFWIKILKIIFLIHNLDGKFPFLQFSLCWGSYNSNLFSIINVRFYKSNPSYLFPWNYNRYKEHHKTDGLSKFSAKEHYFSQQWSYFLCSWSFQVPKLTCHIHYCHNFRNALLTFL